MYFSNLWGARNGWKSLVYVAFAGVCLAQVDPGPRAGAAGAAFGGADGVEPDSDDDD